MKRFFKASAFILALLVVVYFLGPKPRQPIYAKALPEVPTISQLDNFVAAQTLKHKVKKGNAAEIIWADSSKNLTEYAVVYLHGFSASKEEGNPVHKNFAKSIKANLYLSRLADHGVDTIAPMEYMTADRLWNTAQEAYAIGKKLGKKVIVIGTSTGGTLALQLAAAYPEIHSLILMSPNIAINDNKAWLLNKPWGLQIARLVSGGRDRKVDSKSAEYRKYWHTTYRLESVVALQELVETTMRKELFATVKQPTLLLYYYKNEKQQDKVVSVPAALKMFDQLGTPTSQKEKVALPNVANHVMGSWITSKDLPSVERAIHNFATKHIIEPN